MVQKPTLPQRWPVMASMSQLSPPNPQIIDTAWYQRLPSDVLAQFCNLDMQVITLREGTSASNYTWSACLHGREEFLVSQRYEVTEVVDRVDGGAATVAALATS